MDEGRAAALKSAGICRLLTAGEIDAIAAVSESLTVAAGSELFREGDPGDGLYLVVWGEIDIAKRTPAGERSLARLGAGGVLGEMSLLTDEPRSATGRALADAAVLRLPAARFRALLAEGSSAALKIVGGIAEMLAHRVAAMNAQVLELAAKAEQGTIESEKARTEKLVELHRKLQVWSF
jgi:CRP-like cAMP-binding protein